MYLRKSELCIVNMISIKIWLKFKAFSQLKVFSLAQEEEEMKMRFLLALKREIMFSLHCSVTNSLPHKES